LLNSSSPMAVRDACRFVVTGEYTFRVAQLVEVTSVSQEALGSLDSL
jgi:hypothetical protein